MVTINQNNPESLWSRWFTWTQTVLPTTYTNALSYYEVVNALVEKIGEIVEYVEGLEEAAVEEANKYTDAQVATLRSDIEQEIARNEATNQNEHMQMRSEYRQLAQTNSNRIGELEGDVDALHELILQKTSELNNQVTKLWIALGKINASVDDKLADVLEEMKAYVDSLITDITGDIPVINPTTGKTDTLQNTLNDLWDSFNLFAITAREFDRLGLTAAEYDALMMTAWDYDHYFKIFMLERKWFYMYSPFTGKLVPVREVVQQLAELHEQGITAEEYDALELTANGYDAKEITAHDYDWKGKVILGGGINIPEGLSPEARESFANVIDLVNTQKQKVEDAYTKAMLTESTLQDQQNELYHIKNDANNGTIAMAGKLEELSTNMSTAESDISNLYAMTDEQKQQEGRAALSALRTVITYLTSFAQETKNGNTQDAINNLETGMTYVDGQLNNIWDF